MRWKQTKPPIQAQQTLVVLVRKRTGRIFRRRSKAAAAPAIAESSTCSVPLKSTSAAATVISVIWNKPVSSILGTDIRIQMTRKCVLTLFLRRCLDFYWLNIEMLSVLQTNNIKYRTFSGDLELSIVPLPKCGNLLPQHRIVFAIENSWLISLPCNKSSLQDQFIQVRIHQIRWIST